MNSTTIDLQDAAVGLAVTLGVGLLIGIERERRKGQGEDRAAAGLRTFTVAALAGALAQLLPMPGLVVLGAGVVALLAALSYWKSQSRDPGLTTELALFVTYLIGVQTMLAPALGAACGAGLALLLAARRRLHRLATDLLSEQELHDGLLLAALALIVLPLIPSRPIALLGGIDPRPLAAMVVLILAIQAAGHMAVRWLGARAGMLGSGFVSGFISSTATVASFGSKARAQPAQAVVLAGGAALSGVATWVQALVLSAALSPAAAAALLPVALAGAAGAAAIGVLPLLSRRSQARIEPPSGARSALRPREALAVAVALAIVALLVSNAQIRFGDAGLQISVALAALADAHSPIASMASLHAAGKLTAEHFVRGALIAVSANTLTRCTVAVMAGGPAYALRVGGALVLSLALAWTAALLLSGAG
ncbi:MgtC/SapB family protein [Variovorax sp. RA8]|uniref:MgtC/SapB family protein n=1 Tax=Variovorax sp. (strain JCM 16519 / RA8) TaxID=662548 RepID=UPI00131817C4|nr:MgtC/SapB family protein [Variovorax sp. RA8]VTU29085.1 MgtC family protein [Variovorax sp. RA8]